MTTASEVGVQYYVDADFHGNGFDFKSVGLLSMERGVYRVKFDTEYENLEV